jgi:hypothetical protein
MKTTRDLAILLWGIVVPCAENLSEKEYYTLLSCKFFSFLNWPTFSKKPIKKDFKALRIVQESS